ncbi:hypothetical protein [Rahnella sp. PD4]|uniref:hypothetical protein n=1 Tax=Rahnella sp. PD4 TaxID=3368611 RepID=UPI003B9FC677
MEHSLIITFLWKDFLCPPAAITKAKGCYEHPLIAQTGPSNQLASPLGARSERSHAGQYSSMLKFSRTSQRKLQIKRPAISRSSTLILFI